MVTSRNESATALDVAKTSVTKSQETLSREDGLDFLRQMMLIRRFEERAEQAYTEGKIGGFLHLYIGEESIAVGAMNALEPDDDVITHYRDHGYALARGLEPNKLMAELFGKETGVSKGKGGSMHLADVERHFWGGYAIVGGHIPLAVGLALASQYQNLQRVTLCVFGDGATNIGMFHESLNLAAVWKVPLVILVENNQYGMGTAVARASAVTELYKKACAYDIPAERIDGHDLLAVYQAVQKSADKARRGEGPQFIEALTYRFRGHSMGDPQRYRTKAEVEKAREQDPIQRFKQQLADLHLATQEDFEHLGQEVNATIQEAVDFAESSPQPEPADLYKDILVPEAMEAP